MLRALVGDDSATFPAGAWLWLDLCFERPAALATVREALADMGLSPRTDARVTQARARKSLPGAPPVTSPHEHRFVAKTSRKVTLRSQPGLLWAGVSEIPFDPDEALVWKQTPVPLEQGRAYALRFLSIDRTAARADDVATLLEALGWVNVDVFCARANMRVPRRPGTDTSEWFAFARWGKPSSLVCGEEPFFFERVVPLPLTET